MSNSLYLFPAQPHAAPPPRRAVREVLGELGCIAGPLTGGGFAVGQAFLQLVTFAGCSPHLVFTPPAPGSRDFCHLELLGPYRAARMYTGPHTAGPRCPHCNARLRAWQAMREAWQAGSAWPCPACGQAATVERWRWRRQAAFGRLLIVVRQVFPSEGVPSDRLLTALAQATGTTWDYAWAA
jgi:hypothetical protein